MNFTHELFVGGKTLLAIIIAVALLAACSGGGGGVSPPVASGVSGSGTSNLTLAAFAGQLVTSGSGRTGANGAGPAAVFSGPMGVATDNMGNVYVADTGINTIRKITPAGVVTTLAGTVLSVGSNDGTGSAASFNDPVAIACDSARNLYVADAGNSTIRKITPAGVVTTLAGSAGVYGGADGVGAAAQFGALSAITIDSADNIYVGDTRYVYSGNGSGRTYFGQPANPTIRKITPDGVVTTLVGSLSTYYDWGKEPFIVAGLATDGAGDVYMSDASRVDPRGNSLPVPRSTIRKITPSGVMTTLAGTLVGLGSANGTGAAASFSYPRGMATDREGNLYVADVGNSTIRRITPGGTVTTLAGTAGSAGSTDGPGAVATFNFPGGVATDGAGNVYVADSANSTIRKISTAGVVTTLAGSPPMLLDSTYRDGTGTAARFHEIGGIASDGAGNLYVADYGNFNIRKITSAGVVTTLAGSFRGAMDDGTGSAASFQAPRGIASDSAGNLYVADTGNAAIRKITPDGVVTTIANSAATAGSADGPGAVATFNVPWAVATDGAGNVYVADTINGTIRKISTAGVVTTLAGMPGQWGYVDGTGSAARFAHPSGIVADSAGNLYVADSYNHSIRKITPEGAVTTLAGAGVEGNADGIGAAARFSAPWGLTVDHAGNVYVADTGNSTIRKITPDRVVTTLVGIPGENFFKPGALPAMLSNVVGVAISGTSLYIATTTGIAVVNNLP